MPKFPDRWLDYSNIGDVIEGTRIITFKVPLKENFFNEKPKDTRFTPATLIENIKKKELKLGLVIDLTFTTRYYDKEEFTEKGVQYKKIFVEGHVIPSQDVMNEFYDAVDDFLKSSEKDSLIGVHCTHGVNRTGYVVCRYMVEHLKKKATESLLAYKTARGYPVERINYINDLKRRAKEPVPEEDQKQEEQEEKERKEKSLKKSARKNQPNNPSDEAGGHSHSDRSYEHSNYQNRQYIHNSYDAGWDRNYDDHGNVMWNGNYSGGQYGYGSGNWGNTNGQYVNQDVIAEYQLDPNVCYGYDIPGRPAHLQHNQGYSDGGYYSNSGGPYIANSNLPWGSGAYQGPPHGHQSHIQSNGATNYNWRKDSYDDRSYSRQNSDSRKHGRANKGSNRMKPF